MDLYEHWLENKIKEVEDIIKNVAETPRILGLLEGYEGALHAYKQVKNHKVR